MCLGVEHVRLVLMESECTHCETFTMNKLCLDLAPFSRDVGQASAMAMLQAYQADLLKDLDQGQALSPEAVKPPYPQL